MNNKHTILDRVIHGSELASQPLPTVPLVEVMGFTRVLIENHSCISSYSHHEIDVQVRNGFITVCGEDLHLARMSAEQLVITGSIQQIRLHGGKNG